MGVFWALFNALYLQKRISKATTTQKRTQDNKTKRTQAIKNLKTRQKRKSKSKNI